MGGLTGFVRGLSGVDLFQELSGANAAERAGELGYQASQAGIAEQARQFDIYQQNLQPYLQAGTQALPQYQQGIGQAPSIPTLQGFQGQAVSAPTLQQFQFDPSRIAESPAYQFQLQQGTNQLNRLAGANRELGSGQRLAAAQEFGQGLAAQSIGQEFQRQLAANQAANQTASQQFGLNTENLGQRQALAQQEQNRLLQQYGLSSDAFNQRLNRLAGLVDIGRGSGSALGQAGANYATNTANLLQAGAAAQGAAQIGASAANRNLLIQGVGLAAGLPSGGGGGGFVGPPGNMVSAYNTPYYGGY